MAKEIRAHPTALVHLATQTLAASQQLGDGYRDGIRSLAVPSDAFGNTAAAPAVQAAHEHLVEVAGGAVAVLVGTLEADVDSLYRTAADYQRSDRVAADLVGGSRGGK